MVDPAQSVRNLKMFRTFEPREDLENQLSEHKIFLGTVTEVIGGKTFVSAAFGNRSQSIATDGTLISYSAAVRKAGLIPPVNMNPSSEDAKALLAIEQREFKMRLKAKRHLSPM